MIEAALASQDRRDAMTRPAVVVAKRHGIDTQIGLCFLRSPAPLLFERGT